jgi:hypothetical protein
MSNAASVVPDPFADDLFAPLAPNDPEGSFEDEIQKIADEQGISTEVPAPIVDPAPATPKAADEPQVYAYEDGSQVTIEHGNRGWKATLDSNTGAPVEVFYGSTKDELLVNLSAGKINATQKIRELSKKTKLGIDPTDTPVAPVSVPANAAYRNLTADEIFELKTKLQDDPDAAIGQWFQKKTGLSLEEFVKVAKTGKAASDELSAEAISKEFLRTHEEYVPYEKNFEALIAWLCKYKLNQPLQGRDPNAMIEVLFNAGQWTAETLDEAYQDLVNDGLLDLRDEEEEAATVVVPAAPAAPAAPVTPAAAPSTTSNDRIVRERRPRAGNANLGIRTSETVARNTEVATPPSVEELDNLSDGDVEKLLTGVRQLRLGTRR